MKRLSWEIILAGLFFIAVAIYLIDKPSGDNNHGPETAETPNEPTPPTAHSPIRVIDIEGLKELASLDELKELESLEDVDQAENLKKLKALAHLIPSEARDEFLTEIDKVLREFSDGDIQINFDSEDQLIIVNHEYETLEQGNWGETSPGVYTYVNDFDATDITETSISLPGGSITVVGTNENKAKFTVQASGQISSKEDLDSKISTTSSINDGEAIFSIDTKEKSRDSNLQLQVTLYIPENMELSTYTAAGHIEATNINGDQVYETGGGHIKLNRVSGDIIAVSKGGHVSIEDAKGDVIMKSSGGHLVLKKCTGDATLDTKGGNIEIKDVDGEIISSTLGGNIMIALNNLNEDITAETSAGNIQIFIPSNSKADIDIQASNTSDLNGFSNMAFDGRKTKNKASGKLNGGGSEIIAFTKYGKVIITGNE
tara:strand:+ start:2024 stop:3310 length:1287 start_codon:yes stop_codon:yes gene_type:complete